MTRRFLSFLPVVVAVVGLFGAGVPSAGAAPGTAAAGWQILQANEPSLLPPGAKAEGAGSEANIKYRVNVLNVGGLKSEPLTITDAMSPGVTPSSSEPALVEYEEASEETAKIPCTSSGQTVSCKVAESVKPGGSVAMFIPIDVAAVPPSQVTNVVTVSSASTAPVVSEIESETGSEKAPFGFVQGAYGESFSVSDEAGEAPEAGSHPFIATVSAHIPTALVGEGPGKHPNRPVDPLRSLELTLPQGIVVDPMATGSRCPLADLNGGIETPPSGCSPEAQVGVVQFSVLGGLENLTEPIFNMVPPPGVPAEVAFSLEKTVVHIPGGLDGGFHLTAGAHEILSKFPVSGVTVQLWGNPSDARHDYQRRGVGLAELGCGGFNKGCSIAASRAPFLTMPSSCSDATRLGGVATGWLGGVAQGSVPLSARDGGPITIVGCSKLPFAPSIESQATTNQGESASGLNFAIHQTQEESTEGVAAAALRDATVTLPEGMTLNPASANGLASCTEQQMGYAPEDGKVRFSTDPQACPNAAKVGTITVQTPLLEQPQPGAIYVAKPFNNPFGSLLAIYLAIEDEETGIIAKLAGKIEPDPVTGRLTARFTENPELPLENISLHFFSGSRGTLKTPLSCGTSTTTSTLTPWTTPEGADAHPSDSFEVSESCSGSEAVAPRTVGFTAGTVTPLAGAYSPFVLKISRPDGSQHITGIETTLPGGLLGRLAGVSYCPESGIAQAKSREAPEKGKLEQASASCPPSSEVGTVQVTAGAGSTPIPVLGHAYLAGPYKGAPLSLVVIVPAVAGPFDLGNVVSRVALNVGEYDARIHAVSDPLPTILDGIPLDIRSIEIKLNRPGFTLNPTSCEVMAIEGSVTTQPGQTAPLKNRFQVGECGRLAFKPTLALSLKGPTKRTGHPALKAVVTYPKKGLYANIARAQVSLPHSEFLDQNNIGKACTKPLLAARACPSKSIYGKARAWTPLLEKPLEGPVYLVGGYGYKLPALVAELNGQIRVLLVGKVDSDKRKGIRNTFEAVPDAPVSRFVLELKGGKKYGLLVNSENICKKTQRAGVAFRAQNGRVKTFSVKIANNCMKTQNKHRKRK